jgi:protein involved in polysaccharide export with SLBB domain
VERPAPRVTVLGSVFRPGSFATKSDLSLLEVLAQVGGWTLEADLRYVRINRQATGTTEASSLEINLALIMSRGNTRMIPMIRPGDVLIVPQRENVVRELSEFLRDALLLLGTFRIFGGVGGGSL